MNCPVILSSTVVAFSVKTGFYFLFPPSPCFNLPINRMLCGHIFQIHCTCPWRTCSYFALFLQILVLEPSLLDIVILVCWYHPTLFYRTRGFLSWGPCMAYLICWHCKILSHVCILLVTHQIYVPSSHFHISSTFPWLYWISDLNYIVCWTIWHGLGLRNWSCTCYVCLFPH